MDVSTYPDARLLSQIENVYLLLLEADDWAIPHDPSEWEGRPRWLVAGELHTMLVHLEAEADRRRLDVGAARRRAEADWELKHGDWAGTY